MNQQIGNSLEIIILTSRFMSCPNYRIINDFIFLNYFSNSFYLARRSLIKFFRGRSHKT